ncbi:hypothetical protein LguiA_033474 [Lonicera macranthoides]
MGVSTNSGLDLLVQCLNSEWNKPKGCHSGKGELGTKGLPSDKGKLRTVWVGAQWVVTAVRANLGPRDCHSNKGELRTVWVGAQSQVRFLACETSSGHWGRLPNGIPVVQGTRSDLNGFCSRIKISITFVKSFRYIGYARKLFDDMILRGVGKGAVSGINGSIIVVLVVHGLCLQSRVPEALMGSVVDVEKVSKKKRKLGMAPRANDYREFILSLISDRLIYEAKELGQVIVGGNFPIQDDVLNALMGSLNLMFLLHHALCTITVHKKEATVGDEEIIKYDELNLVDLLSPPITVIGRKKQLDLILKFALMYACLNKLALSSTSKSVICCSLQLEYNLHVLRCCENLLQGRAREAGEMNSLLTMGHVINSLVEHSVSTL